MKARPSKPRFTGGFKTFSVSVSINRENRVEGRLFVFSQGSRTKVLEYLWLKHLWDELSRLEFKLLILSGVLNSDLKFDCMKAINKQGKKATRERLQVFFPDGEYSRERYQGFKRLDVEIYEYQRSLPKTPKFSGWIRTASAKGTKRPSGGSSYLETLTSTEYIIVDRIDWYELLTVGDSKRLFPAND
jgi:hypothetical protein